MSGWESGSSASCSVATTVKGRRARHRRIGLGAVGLGGKEDTPNKAAVAALPRVLPPPLKFCTGPPLPVITQCSMVVSMAAVAPDWHTVRDAVSQSVTSPEAVETSSLTFLLIGPSDGIMNVRHVST